MVVVVVVVAAAAAAVVAFGLAPVIVVAVVDSVEFVFVPEPVVAVGSDVGTRHPCVGPETVQRLPPKPAVATVVYCLVAWVVDSAPVVVVAVVREPLGPCSSLVNVFVDWSRHWSFACWKWEWAWEVSWSDQAVDLRFVVEMDVVEAVQLRSPRLPRES